ncbi:MAG TPA: winged helix-turn-helix domain-containing protein, partial [Blastocatellia bacterium]|nr:winged helix-turn-helix domain-containing protein [Blastocatellia bacterium]
MRSAQTTNPEPTTRFYEFGPFRVDKVKRLLSRAGEPVPLTPKAFDTLLLLVENSGQLVTKDALMSELWPDTFVEEGSLTRNISALRKALGENPREHRYIVTVPGQGYSFVAKVRHLSGETGNLKITERIRTSIIVTEESDAPGHSIDIEAVTPDAEAQSKAADSRLLASEPTPTQERLASRFGVKHAFAFVTVLLAAIGATAFVTYKLFTSARQDRQAASTPNLVMNRLTVTGNVANARAAISPDGRFVAYVVTDSPRTNSLWLKQIATLANDQLMAPAEVEYSGLTFSRDGNHIYYVARDKSAPIFALYRIPLIKGPPRKLLEDLDGAISFSPDGGRFVFPRNHPARREATLVVANEDGSEQQEVAVIKHPEFFGEASWSPDGKVIVCGAGHADGGVNRYVIQVSVGDWVMRELSSQRWRWVGPVEWLADQTGLLMIASDHVASPYQIWHLSYPNGIPRRVTNDTITYTRMNSTTDSTALVALQLRQVTNIWVAPIADVTQARRITFGSGGYRGKLCWTRDRKIIFESQTAGAPDISIMNEDGTDQRHLLGDLTGRAWAGSPAVSPDGRFVYFSYDSTGSRQVWRVDRDGSNPIQLTTVTGGDVLHCSPDGRWIVFSHPGTERPTIWKVAADGGEPVLLTSNSA